jgi:N-acetylglucosamine-6-sulfatase
MPGATAAGKSAGRLLGIASVIAAASCIAAASLAGSAAGQGPPPRPNVIVVMTDDQPTSLLNRSTMPRTMRLVGGKGAGTRFTRGYVSSPLCCPSRAGFLTGAYPHNSGVFDNTPGYAGLRRPTRTLYTWLHDAGYRTALIGRFLLNYEQVAGGPAPPAPPGVDEWFGFAQDQTRYFSAPFSDNGTLATLGGDRGGYTTRVLNQRAANFVRSAGSASQPFFLWLAHLAPHSTNFDARGHCGSGAPAHEPGTYGPWAREPLPRPPSFGEQANRDKPRWIQSRHRLRPRQIAALEKGWRCAHAALDTVDRGIAALVRALKDTGELARTAIFFTSDNGYLYGEHRVVLQKIYPYEEAWRVPLLARVPRAYTGGAPPPRFVSSNVNLLDLTATVLDLTGARPCTGDGACDLIDGRSLLPTLGAPGPAWPADRALLAQIGNRRCGVVPGPESGLKNFYDAIRTRRYMYAEINRVNPVSGACDRPEFELYDMHKDPYQLRNIAVNPAVKPPSATQRSLAERLHALARCAGSAGRDVSISDYAGFPLCE